MLLPNLRVLDLSKNRLQSIGDHLLVLHSSIFFTFKLFMWNLGNVCIIRVLPWIKKFFIFSVLKTWKYWIWVTIVWRSSRESAIGLHVSEFSSSNTIKFLIYLQVFSKQILPTFKYSNFFQIVKYVLLQNFLINIV